MVVSPRFPNPISYRFSGNDLRGFFEGASISGVNLLGFFGKELPPTTEKFCLPNKNRDEIPISDLAE